MKTETEYREALTEVEQLFNAHPGTAEGDRLDIMTLLVEAYEQQHCPIPPPDPIAALEYHLESRGLNRRDLEPFLGTPSRVEDILSRRRGLTITMIRRLHRGLGISADVLIQPYPLRHRPAEPMSQARSTASI